MKTNGKQTKKQLIEKFFKILKTEYEKVDCRSFVYIKSSTRYYTNVKLTIFKTDLPFEFSDMKYIKVRYISYGNRKVKKTFINLTKRDIEIFLKYYQVLSVSDY